MEVITGRAEEILQSFGNEGVAKLRELLELDRPLRVNKEPRVGAVDIDASQFNDFQIRMFCEKGTVWKVKFPYLSNTQPAKDGS